MNANIVWFRKVKQNLNLFCFVFFNIQSVFGFGLKKVNFDD